MGDAQAGAATAARDHAWLAEGNRALLELIAQGAPLEVTLERLLRTVEAQSNGRVLGSVLLLDRDGVHLRHGAAPSLPAAYNAEIDGLPIGPAVGSCGTAAYRREPVVVRDIDTDPLWEDFRTLAREHGLRACWSTPIVGADGALLGTFAMYYTDEREPAGDEQALVEVVTRTAAIAIERRRLEEDREQLLAAEQTARREAERSLSTVAVLHEVGQAINASLDLQAVVQTVTDAATSLAGARFGAFFYNVIGADGEAYTLYTLSGAPRSAFERFPMPRNTAIFGPTFRGTSVVRLADVRADPRYGKNAPYHGMPEGHLPVRSYLAAPVKTIEGEVLGGLFFGHEEVGVFTEEAERIVVGIAAQAAVAIERAQLYLREQEARAEAERRAQAALSLEHVDNGVCLVDDGGIVQVWNPAAATIFGAPGSDVLGRTLEEAVPELAAVAVRAPRVSSPASGEVAQPIPLTVGAQRLWLAITAIEFAGGVVYTFRDQSEEHRLEQTRADIIATVSHEVRTPLAAIYGAAQTLARADLDEGEVRPQFVRMIVTETQRLNRVVDQILLASDGSAQRRALALEPVELAEVAGQVLDLAAFRELGVELELRVEDAGPVVADRDNLQQVVTNLVDNAAKYGHAGDRIVVRTSRERDRSRLAVVDFGAGVPEHEAERIFERFYRLDPQQREGVSGTGLGLHISRELVRQLGGDLWVERTEPGGGATFVVDLPRRS